MKIFFICSDIPYPGYTGGSTINWSILESLLQEGHKITLFCDAPREGWNEIDRKILSDLAVYEPLAFEELVSKAKSASA